MTTEIKNEEVIETETPSTETVTTPPVEKKEEAPAKKLFAEMTEEEKLNLPDDELLKYLDGQEDEGPAEDSEEEGEKEEKEEDKDLDADDEFERLDKLSKADFDKEPREKKGLFYEMKKERTRRQSLEAEIEKEREIRKAQLEVMEKMRGKQEGGADNRTETEKVKAVIAEKAKKYEEEYGEEYRLSFRDVEALDEAKSIDAKRESERSAREQQQKETHNVIATTQKKINQEVEKLKSSGYDDIDYVYKNFIDPVINPEIAKDPEEARHYASMILHKVMKGDNAIEYAYKYLAKMTPEGEKYFREKEQKQVNKKLAEEATKKTTKTSSHVQTRPTDGKTKVTIKMLNDEFEKWEKKLNEEQFRKVANGEDVYI